MGDEGGVDGGLKICSIRVGVGGCTCFLFRRKGRRPDGPTFRTLCCCSYSSP
jgi:hypothetical protein